ncbi:MAG: hypothetical protein ACOCVG_00100 [Verrucomicrobiota bacterium]
MKKLFAYSRQILLGGLLALFLPCWASAQIELDPIVKAGERRELQVAIVSADSEVQVLARRAAGLHGGLKLTDEAKAQFVFRLARAGGTQVDLGILSGTPPQVLETHRAAGATLSASVAEAMDHAVERTLGVAGFFAGEVVFAKEQGSASELFIGDILFQNVRQITNHQSDSVLPRWRPDGQAVVYTSYFRSGFPDIFMLQLPGGPLDTVAAFNGTNTGATFSPRGDHMAMILSADGSPELFIADAQGNNPRRLTHNRSLEATPTWSPDGTRLAFTGDPRGRPQIYLISSSGGTPQRVPTDISGYCSEPTWHPRNPSLLAFTANIGGFFQTVLYDFNQQRSQPLTSGNVDIVEPTWLNDGRHLIVTVRENNRQRLHVLDSVTGKLAPLHSPGFGNTKQADYLKTR